MVTKSLLPIPPNVKEILMRIRAVVAASAAASLALTLVTELPAPAAGHN